MMEAQAALKEKVIKGIRLHKVSTLHQTPESSAACCPRQVLSHSCSTLDDANQADQA